MQTYPENVQPDSRATLATLIYGKRFHADQTLAEYLIEFLLIFCAEKEQNDGGRLRFHNPDNKDVLYYTVEPRMGLKRFIFFDKSKKNDAALIDKMAYQKLLDALSKKIKDADSNEKADFLESLQDLFHGYAVVLKKRTWCAQAMLPICPEVIFCEAMPKKKDRAKLDWDKISNDSDKKSDVDNLFDFDKRNFLARGGELYYLHILQGLQKMPKEQARLEYFLRDLLLHQGNKMSKIASFIQSTWEETMGYDESPKKRLKLAYIPENAYKDVAGYSVDELINYLSCRMHPVKKIELLSKGVMLQILRMLSIATTKYLREKRDCWIIDMKGLTENIVKKISSNGFRKVEDSFVSALGQKSVEMSADDVDKRMQEVRKARKDSLDIFRSKGKELQCIIPMSGPYERFTLPEDSIRFLVLAIVKPGEKMTIDMFLDELYKHYRMVIGPTEYKLMTIDIDNSLTNSFLENKLAFQEFLKATGFLHELSDATSIVVNPYEKIKEDKA